MKYPSWLKKKIPKANHNKTIRQIIGDESIHTVCESALCPNRGECFSNNTVTFMILGDVCTRNCRFCAVPSSTTHPRLTPLPLLKERAAQNMLEEPEKIAEITKRLWLKHVVVTSVTRDDLTDGGAQHFANVIETIRKENPKVTIEVLTPDFQGNIEALQIVLNARPEVFNHNVETVERLYGEIRPEAEFQRSLRILKHATSPPAPLRKQRGEQILVKSGFMVGLGETEAEIKELLQILKGTGVDIVTIGQYIAPSKNHYPIKEFVHPDKFEEYRKYGQEIGLKYVFAGPFVRSSYMAHEALIHASSW